jgi:hypothetical protein
MHNFLRSATGMRQQYHGSGVKNAGEMRAIKACCILQDFLWLHVSQKLLGLPRYSRYVIIR